MMPYYWTPTTQQQMPPQVMPPQTTGARPPGREQSYIENILRLNRGKPATFHFSFEHAVEPGKNTKIVRGVVEAAGRDHVILRELKSNHRFLFPMIYFDFAEYDEEMAYFNQNP